jgi:carboxyl-terminal processing protease
MQSDDPLTPNHNRRLQFFVEASLILIVGVAFFAYIIYSPGSTPLSRARVTQTPSSLYNPVQSPLTTSGQLAFFDQIWTIVNDKYLYTQFNGLDWNAIHSEYKGKIEAGMNEDVFYQDMEELIGKLGNRHTRFLPPRKNVLDAASIGLALISIPGENRADVVQVIPHGSADLAGILCRDRILAIDGKPTPVSMSEVGYLINGVSGTQVNLTVQTPGQESRQVELTRGYIQGPLPVPYKVYTTTGGKKIGSIVLVSFYYGSLKDQITEAINAMSSGKPLEGLIVDVRANGGGEHATTLETLSYFTHGTIGYFVTRGSNTPIDIPDRDISGTSQIPLVVLISPMTASGGGIFAGVLQDMGRAYLIGERTDTTLDTTKSYHFSDGSFMQVAAGAIHPINHPDQTWVETGIAPDLVVKPDWNEFMSENDPVIRAALVYFDR